MRNTIASRAAGLRRTRSSQHSSASAKRASSSPLASKTHARRTALPSRNFVSRNSNSTRASGVPRPRHGARRSPSGWKRSRAGPATRHQMRRTCACAGSHRHRSLRAHTSARGRGFPIPPPEPSSSSRIRQGSRHVPAKRRRIVMPWLGAMHSVRHKENRQHRCPHLLVHRHRAEPLPAPSPVKRRNRMCVSPWRCNQGAQRSRVETRRAWATWSAAPPGAHPSGRGAKGWLGVVALLAQADAWAAQRVYPSHPLAPRRTSDFSVSLD